jgi:DNA-packaging protein gp3
MAKKQVKDKSLYKPEYAEQLIEYFSEAPYREVMKTVVTKLGDAIEVPTTEATDFKSLAAFANKLGVHRDTLHEWSKVHPDFSDAYKRAKQYQEEFLSVNGNKGLINPAFSIFTAKNVLQWRDKQPDEVDQVNVNINNGLSDRLTKARQRKQK